MIGLYETLSPGLLAILVTPTIPNINNRKKVGKWLPVGRVTGAYGSRIGYSLDLVKRIEIVSSGYRANQLQGPYVDYIAILYVIRGWK